MTGVRVLLVDDHAGFREAAAAFLEAGGLRVVGRAATGEEALEVVVGLDPDIVLVDFLLPGIDGVDVAWGISATVDPPVVILISSYEDAPNDPRVATAPIAGFLSKRDLTCAAVLTLAG